MERINTYEMFLEQEGIPVIRDYSIPDLMEVPLKPWARKGGLGAYINLVGAGGVIDAYLCEIPPGKALEPQKHMFDELIYILSGYGATSVWVKGGPKQSFEWHEGSLFAIPLNASHQHFNGRSDKPVRYIGLTKAPVFMTLFNDLEYIFNSDHVFSSRYSGEEGYFSAKGNLIKTDDKFANPKIWESNFVPDCNTFTLVNDPKRGGFSNNAHFEFAGGIMSAHISEFPGGTYMKAHWHGPGAHLLCLSGEGYELMWPLESGLTAKGVERLKIDWKKGSIFSPPDRWFHQHFSTGKEPTKLLAFHGTRSLKYKPLGSDYGGVAGARKSIKHGGLQIEYADEDPEIRRLFQEELGKTGVSWKMSKFFS
ncbi:MAG: cupin domain-containing protein [Desulfobacterales bacterium]|nr:cupin domain-containing protein [Desulfobacterales bacterium]